MEVVCEKQCPGCSPKSAVDVATIVLTAALLKSVHTDSNNADPQLYLLQTVYSLSGNAV